MAWFVKGWPMAGKEHPGFLFEGLWDDPRNFASREHISRLAEGMTAWNAWRGANPGVKPNLVRANLTFMNRRKYFAADGEELEKADFAGADLRSANLSFAYLHGLDLSGADLRDAKLGGANLEGANLTGADLSRANLHGTNLAWAMTVGSDFTNAKFGRTIFVSNDLSRAKGLQTVEHWDRSAIGIDTVYKSQNSIPLVFLRGCGVPENFITYIPSLVVPGAIQFYSCFISYSTKDQEFADRLYADLQNKGVRCWFAPHDVQGGKKLHEQIDEAIRRYERLLLILSPHSMSSKWVKTEIRNARKREVAEKKRVLFPVRLASYEALRDWKLFDGDEGEDLATEIREYYIPDFSEWKNHDLYVRELEKLLRDLRTGGIPTLTAKSAVRMGQPCRQENSLTCSCRCTRAWGPFGVAQGRPFDCACRFASLTGVLRSG
jgi:hypothetical protein